MKRSASRPAPAPARGRFRAWLDERLGLGDLARAVLNVDGAVPGGASFRRSLGPVAGGLVALEAVTGILLAACYAPAVTTAWASVAYIQDQLTLGWFVRGLHSFGASALIVVATLHLAEIVLAGAYRRPRELNWMVGLSLLAVSVLLALSGFLLPWDQKGYWAKLVEVTIVGGVPLVGPPLQRLMQGGAAFGNATLTRAYATHAMLLPALLVALSGLHVYLRRRHGAAARQNAAGTTTPFWPEQAARNAVAGAVAMAIVAGVTVWRHGAPLESPADPASSYLARPEWYALPLYQLRMFFEGPLEILATVVIPALVTALVFALPFLDAAPAGSARPSRRVLGAAAAGALALAALAAIALIKDARDPAYAKARAEEAARTATARRLALEGVPPEGGVAVFRNDPLFRARQTWDERCAGCHGLAGAGGDKGPDLHDYNSRVWIRGFLHNPDGPLYMGPAKLQGGMEPVTNVTLEEMDALVEFVYAQTGAADTDRARADLGRQLFSRKDCDACHEVDGKEESDGPNLAGRGTMPWVVGVIGDASHGLLFGDRNKMPKFRSKLAPAEIEDLARFVVGLRDRR